jgi:hypothetical protein
MTDLNRREFLQTSAASYLIGSAKLGFGSGGSARIGEGEGRVRVEGSTYAWEWSLDTDVFRLLDKRELVLASGKLQPAVAIQRKDGQPGRVCQSGRPAAHKIRGNELDVRYEGVNGSARLDLTWRFEDEGFWLEPVAYEASTSQDVVSLHYFAQGKVDRAVPALESDYFVVPGITTSSEMSPIVPAGPGGAMLNQRCALGRGWADDPSVLQIQQWALPVHYFAGFHNTPYAYQKTPAARLEGASPDDLFDGFCCGLSELPTGDLLFETAGGHGSLVVNYRGDLWLQFRTPGRVMLGCRLHWTVGPNFYEAIRRYYVGIIQSGIIHLKSNSIHKNTVALAPSFCTYGEQYAMGHENERLDEATLSGIHDRMRRAGMKAKLIVVDAMWEGKYGSLQHSEDRLPHFLQTLDQFRAEGSYVGLWAAFMRCQDPANLGLTTAHVLHRPDGKPYLLGASDPISFYIMDCTQPEVQQVLRRRAKEFVRRYKPDFVKFDFGYEIPSLDAAAPQDMNWAGERLMLKALEVTIGAMREENPDLVVLYYSLSPLFVDYFDLHSPDDLGRCTGDFDLEANRRFFFSSLLGEIGVPTWGSSGYDWWTAPDIWFDSAAIGTLGSLQSFSGPEARARATPGRLAKYNGLTQVIRPNNVFSIVPVDAAYHGPERGARSSSWARIENGEVVLVALRNRRLDGLKPAGKFRDLVAADTSLVIASKSNDGLSRCARLAVVPYGDGLVSLKREAGGAGSATVTEHYFSGGSKTSRLNLENGLLRLRLRERGGDGSIVEWVEVAFG